MEPRLANILHRLGLPTDLDRYLFEQPQGTLRKSLRAALMVDKKRREHEIHFVVLRRPGVAEVVPLSPERLAVLLKDRL
jgi:3-dehydroquinate synthetase